MDRAWPDVPRRLTDDEVVTFAALWAAGRIMSNVHLPAYAAIAGKAVADPLAMRSYTDEFQRTWPFWSLYLKAYGAPPESFTEKIGIFWSRIDEMENGAFTDVPNVMHADDFRAIMKAIEESQGGG